MYLLSKNCFVILWKNPRAFLMMGESLIFRGMDVVDFEPLMPESSTLFSVI